MIICPNFSNPDVAREFEELKQATSEAAAYHIWSLNNGNAIDRAPNGAPSKLFLTLLLEFDGDRTKAIQAKAKVYSKSFINWFGDWTGNGTYEVYQGRTSEQPDGRRYNYWSLYENDAKTYGPNVRKVRINPTGFLFKNDQRWRTNFNGERVFDWGWSEEYEKVFAEFKEKTGYKYFDILDNSKEGLIKQNEFFEFLESKGYKGYAEVNELELQEVEHDNPYTVTFGNNGVIDSDVSKVVDENGEPLVVYHSNDAENFDSNRQYNWFSSKRQTYYGNHQYSVFLNVKTLFKKDNPTMEERAMITDYGTGNKYDKLPKEYDGAMVYHKTFGYYELLTTRNPNQIKSATDNIGIFSKEYNEIDDSESPLGNIMSIDAEFYDLKLLGEQLRKKCKGE